MKERDETEARRLGAERWAMKKCSRKVRFALRAISRAAFKTKTHTIIPLKVVNDNLEESLLAVFVIGKLKEMGFGVYCRERGTDRRIQEYCATWGRDSKIPNGFKLV